MSARQQSGIAATASFPAIFCKNSSESYERSRNDAPKVFTQVIRLCNIMALPIRQEKAQWIAQSIYPGMDLGAKPVTTARFLSTIFGALLPHKDVLAQPCCPTEYSPYQGHPQNIDAYLPKHHDHTSEQSVYRRCSSSHISQVVIAIAPCCVESSELHQQTVGIFPHYHHRLWDGSAKRSISSSIGLHVLWRLSCRYYATNVNRT